MSRKASQVHSDARFPEAALRHMRKAVEEGRYRVHPRVFDRLFELGLVHSELQSACAAALAEIRLSDYSPPAAALDPPGHAFVWRSKHFNCHMYLKFRLEGRRPVCWLYSLHRPDY